jgi:hypothetical protein
MPLRSWQLDAFRTGLLAAARGTPLDQSICQYTVRY